jgi:hypothetical protein
VKEASMIEASLNPARATLGPLRRWFLALLVAAAILAGAAPCDAADPPASIMAAQPAQPDPLAVHLFWSEGCPHCAEARRFLDALAARGVVFHLHDYEVSGDAANEALFLRAASVFAVDMPVVPLIIVGEYAFAGYRDEQTSGRAIRQAIEACQEGGCPDIVGFLRRQVGASGSAGSESSATGPPMVPETIELPLFGPVSTAGLSLPLLTVLLAAVDGFNPCAMWVLVFLIGLLLGVQDHARMWTLGAAFLITSAAVYFAFMAAWLNVLLLLGALFWIRIAVAAVAVGGGAFYLTQFFRNPAAACAVTNPGERQRLMQRLRDLVERRSLVLALGGIVAVAASVNLIEFLCSAGLPAIYTQVLTLSDLPAWTYYLYLLLYIAVFLVDDLVVFVTAMVTLRASGLTGSYARYSHLIGGIVLLGVGGLLLLRPQWLTFGG